MRIERVSAAGYEFDAARIRIFFPPVHTAHALCRAVCVTRIVAANVYESRAISTQNTIVDVRPGIWITSWRGGRGEEEAMR